MSTSARILARLRARIQRSFHPPRRAIPTRAGLMVLSAPMVLGLAAVSSSNNLLFILLGSSLALVVVSGLMSEANLRGMRVFVRPTGAAYAGEPTRLEVGFVAGPGWRGFRGPAIRYALRFREVTHNPWMPWQRTRGGALDVQLPLLNGSSAKVWGSRLFERRGPQSIAHGELSTEFPFGLLYKLDDADPEVEVLVRPRRVPVPAELADPAGRAAEGEIADRRGLGLELYGLREREDRDPAVRVHALRSLAIGREVVIDMAGVERPIATLGVVGWRAEAAAFERTLELALALLGEWEQRGYAVGLVSEAAHFVPGEASLEEMADHLARLAPSSEAPRAALGSAGLWLLPAGAHKPREATRAIAIARDGGWSWA